MTPHPVTIYRAKALASRNGGGWVAYIHPESGPDIISSETASWVYIDGVKTPTENLTPIYWARSPSISQMFEHTGKEFSNKVMRSCIIATEGTRALTVQEHEESLRASKY